MPDEYETLAGFLMVMLRRVPRRTDSVTCGGYKFEVLDVDSYRIDQVMVPRLEGASKPVPHLHPSRAPSASPPYTLPPLHPPTPPPPPSLSLFLPVEARSGAADKGQHPPGARGHPQDAVWPAGRPPPGSITRPEDPPTDTTAGHASSPRHPPHHPAIHTPQPPHCPPLPLLTIHSSSADEQRVSEPLDPETLVSLVTLSYFILAVLGGTQLRCAPNTARGICALPRLPL